ncbi:phosphomevalonate kinase [Malassezia nana]|uniref:phosphomevalonate kinase n=1 Tax=Malassezia nana TaxID=180528 RepID=A0AAF0EL59_9BASI|nr:phosphomevalonate kinase [Malassezia nana]
MATIVSAPGKVLLTGGYLVLDPAYTGFVLATDARFYTSVTSRSSTGAPLIRVRSPPFADATWVYDLVLPAEAEDMAPEDAAEATRLVQHSEPNPFVSLALLYAAQLAIERHGVARARNALQGLDIVIAGDNAFYSHRSDGQALTLAQLQALPPFHTHSCGLRNVHKTGLGSSAAMTTSLVGALLVHLSIVEAVRTTETLSPASLGLIHNVAQLTHCAAQGKVGSGFDVSASVWGSQVYRRFNPALLKDIMRTEHGQRIIAPGTTTPPREPRALWPVLDPSNALWMPTAPRDATPTATEALRAATSREDSIPRPAPLHLPPGVRLCLADVDAGSNTRTMVGQVSEWRTQNPAWAQQLYAVLAAANQSVSDGLLQLHLLHAQDPRAYAETVSALARVPSADWDTLGSLHASRIIDAFVAVRDAMRSVRTGMRELGTRSGAAVEPPEMTRLLDTTLAGAPGLLGGGVPGAGGYDALFILFLSPDALTSTTRALVPPEVCALWQQYTQLSVGPLLCGAQAPAPAPALEKDGPDIDATPDTALHRVADAWTHARAGLVLVEAEAVPGLAALLAD